MQINVAEFGVFGDATNNCDLEIARDISATTPVVLTGEFFNNSTVSFSNVIFEGGIKGSGITTLG